SVGQRIRCGRNPQASSLAVPSSEGERQREWKHSDTIPPFTLRPPRFDRVLVDAPCSNTGVMRRRVDLRWRVRPEEIDRLRTAQLELLHHGALQIKPAGVDRKSTRLNSSHVKISYAVFCLKKKKITQVLLTLRKTKNNVLS